MADTTSGIIDSGMVLANSETTIPQEARHPTVPLNRRYEARPKQRHRCKTDDQNTTHVQSHDLGRFPRGWIDSGVTEHLEASAFIVLFALPCHSLRIPNARHQTFVSPLKPKHRNQSPCSYRGMHQLPCRQERGERPDRGRRSLCHAVGDFMQEHRTHYRRHRSV